MQNFNISRTANIDFYLKRGDTFYFNFQVQDENDNPVNLDAYTYAEMMIKENENSSSVLTLTSTGGTINIDNIGAGQIVLSASTDSILSNMYYMDLELSNNNFKETVFSGRMFIENDITK